MGTYPIKLPISRGTRDQWIEDEWPLHEDILACRKEGDFSLIGEQFRGGATVVEILDRYKTQVEVRSEAEARILLNSANFYGADDGWDDPKPNYRKALRRFAARLAETTGMEYKGHKAY